MAPMARKGVIVALIALLVAYVSAAQPAVQRISLRRSQPGGSLLASMMGQDHVVPLLNYMDAQVCALLVGGGPCGRWDTRAPAVRVTGGAAQLLWCVACACPLLSYHAAALLSGGIGRQ